MTSVAYLKKLREALERFGEGDMRPVIDTVKDWQRGVTFKVMGKFNAGDAVKFTTSKRHGGFAGGRIVHGIIIGFNRKSVVVRSDEREKWKVAPMLLKKDS
jgi:hypothetical protein